MARFLDEIVAWHRARAAADERDVASLFSRASAVSAGTPPRDFVGGLRRCRTSCPAGAGVPQGSAVARVAVIAEIKRRSPSKGDLAPDLDPVALSCAYAEGGAACLSVLTDAPHFGGSPADLVAARRASPLPVLRKDFTVCRADVADARLMGADAVLLIVAALSDDELRTFAADADSLGMAALVEVHDEAEAERALACGATLVGVNQRDLRTFEVDTGRAVRVATMLGDDAVKVAESGIRGAEDLAPLADAGVDAVLVGETFVRAAEPATAVRAFTALQPSVAG